MRILIDIGHPAHVHLFKYFAERMIEKGHVILFTTREKENEIELLKKYGFNFKSFGRHFKSRRGKIYGLVKFNFQMLGVALRFKPDIFLSHGSIYAAQVAWVLRKPHISLEDTGNMEQIRLYRPFTRVILTPATLKRDLGAKQIRLNTYHEIAYLHPEYFKKSPSVLDSLGVLPEEKYCIIRLVSWNATHDSGLRGFTKVELEELIKYLIKKMKVFISSERELEDSLQKYKLNFSPDQIHNALAFSSLVISEGATLASEAAFLGIPTIYVNPQNTCNIEELAINGCVFQFNDRSTVLEKVRVLAEANKIHNNFAQKASKLMSEKIDLTAFLIWFIESYPESVTQIGQDPGFQLNFL